MTTLINRIKSNVMHPTMSFKLVVGHGGLTGTLARLPADTYIIFLSKPGHLIAQGSVISNPQMFRHSYLRNVISGVIPRWSILPHRFGRWKEHVYGPGDIYPDLSLNFYDHNSSGVRLNQTPFNNRTGVHSINATTRTRHFKGVTAHLSNVIRLRGKGVYIVLACRASSQRSYAGAMSSFRRNFRLTGGTQETLRRIGATDPRTNLFAQHIKNMQARRATHKRRANNAVNSHPAKKRKTAPFPGPSTFAPGRNTPLTRRR